MHTNTSAVCTHTHARVHLHTCVCLGSRAESELGCIFRFMET